MAKRNKKFDAMKAQQAARRKAHFEQGGTLAQWRGCSHTFVDRRKAASKKACRGKNWD